MIGAKLQMHKLTSYFKNINVFLWKIFLESNCTRQNSLNQSSVKIYHIKHD